MPGGTTAPDRTSAVSLLGSVAPSLEVLATASCDERAAASTEPGSFEVEAATAAVGAEGAGEVEGVTSFKGTGAEGTSLDLLVVFLATTGEVRREEADFPLAFVVEELSSNCWACLDGEEQVRKPNKLSKKPAFRFLLRGEAGRGAVGFVAVVDGPC